jgi:hypothetical protein
VQVPLIGAGVKGKSAVINAQRRLNCYLEPQYDADKSKVAIFGSPGTTQVLDNGALPFRGGFTEGDLLYVSQGNTFLEINNAFVINDRNVATRLTTAAGRMSMASNGAVIVMADGANGYNYTIATLAHAQIASAMFASPVTVTAQDGYFLASFDETGPNKNRCQISPDGVNWAALDFRAVETVQGVLIRTHSFNGEVHQFKDKGIEFWAYTGDPTFPFQPIRGASLRVGLAARWSVAEGAGSLYFLGRRGGKGEVGAFELSGHEARSITTPDMAKIFNALATKGDATGYVISIDEHEFYRLSFPAAGVTWEYDAYSSGLLGVPVWNELQSNGGRHVSDLAFTLVDRTYVSDYAAGKLHRIDKDVYTDNGAAIARELVTRHFWKDYDSVAVDELIADFETGVGLAVGQGVDPQVMLQVSRDGGRTWGAEMWRTIGAVGSYPLPSWTRLGSARDFVFKLRMTDPVRFCLAGLGIRASIENVRQVA